MGGFQKTTCSSAVAQFLLAKVQYVLHLGVIHQNPGLAGSLYPRGSEVLQITVRSGETHCSPYNFKIAGLVKKWTIWGIFGPKFPGFFY
jgi:hypothetical protein